jgi:mono/diheme cytochrome c family protein
MKHWFVSLPAALLAAWAFAQSPTAPVPELFRDADLVLGAKLIQDNKCSECHIRRVGGDGTAIYKPAGRINNPGALRGMVDYCSTELNLGLFPEEVTAIAAVLQRDHYRFSLPAKAPTAKP